MCENCRKKQAISDNFIRLLAILSGYWLFWTTKTNITLDCLTKGVSSCKQSLLKLLANIRACRFARMTVTIFIEYIVVIMEAR